MELSEEILGIIKSGKIPNYAMFEDWYGKATQLEAGEKVLYEYLEAHKIKPHAPVVDDGGTVECVCWGCELARKAIKPSEVSER